MYTFTCTLVQCALYCILVYTVDAQSRVARVTANFKHHLLNNLLTPALLSAKTTYAHMSHSLKAVEEDARRSHEGSQLSPEGPQKLHWLFQTPSFSPTHTRRAAVIVNIPRQSARTLLVICCAYCNFLCSYNRLTFCWLFLIFY